jgi:two-component system, sensor histidine kinase RegB
MPPPAPRPLATEAAIVPRWMVGLRWILLLVLAGTLPIGSRLFDFHVRYELAVPALALMAAFNVRAMRRIAAGREGSRVALAFDVAFDLVAIAVVLAASGGAANPMSALFLVHVALAASLLPARVTFLLAGLAACLFASLFALPSGACCPNHPSHGAFSTHLYGMWLSFVLSAGLVAYVLTRVRGALDEQKAEVARLEHEAQANARFASLGTLAAGTAHELATPLATIAVLAGEMQEASGDEEQRAQARGIAAQVTRCRDVITKMQVGARAPVQSAQTSLGATVERAVATWREAHPDAPVRVAPSRGDGSVALAASDLEAALCALLDNALHAVTAAGTTAPIEVAVSLDGGTARVSVEDAGAGVPPSLLGRLGEPFLTTKEPGEGMGLGLFLVRTLVEQAGGKLDVAPRGDASGTRVTLQLSLSERPQLAAAGAAVAR